MSLLPSAIQKDIPSGSVILFGVLNWGLGHATRSIPVINALLKKGHVVHVATDGTAMRWMQQEVNGVIWHELPEDIFVFPGKNMWRNASALLPAVIRHLARDKKQIRMLLQATAADVIISDNRFVFRHSDAKKNIYITHQCRVYHTSGLIRHLLTFVHRFFIRRFDICWIPDDPVRKLAGLLSDPLPRVNIRYVGYLSRLHLPVQPVKSVDFLFLLSGPEPQRSIFENEIIQLGTRHIPGNVCFIRGSQTQWPPGLKTLPWEIHDLADTTIVQDKLATCRVLVCRSGYSTLMDIHALTAKVLLVPTPGQTEQEYLAEHAQQQFENVLTVSQSRFRQYFTEIFLPRKLS